MVNRRHWFLCGYRGSGKSTLGRRLAEASGRPWVDLDESLVRRQGRTIADIFADGGEASFRAIESECLGEVTELELPHVVSLGGGTVLRHDNRERLATHGICIYLQVPIERLIRRIESDPATASQRPALTEKTLEDEVREMMSVRDPIYRQVADHVIRCGSRDAELIVVELLGLLGSADANLG